MKPPALTPQDDKLRIRTNVRAGLGGQDGEDRRPRPRL